MRRVVFVFLVLVLLIFAATVSASERRNNCAHNIIGDVNADGAVSLADVSLMASSWGKHIGQDGFVKGADLNCDWRVGDEDLWILEVGWKLEHSNPGEWGGTDNATQ